MAKEIKVALNGKNIIVLLEDASKEDYIDLSTIQNVDLTNIERLFDEAKDKIYQKKIKEAKEQFEEESQKNIELALIKQSAEFDKKYSEAEHKIKELEEASKRIKEDSSKDLELALEKQSNEFNQKEQANKQQISDLKNKLAALEKDKDTSIELAIKTKEVEHQKEIAELKDVFQKEMDHHKEEYDKLNNEYAILKNLKSSTNNKMIGENLQKYCDALFKDYQQTGLQNCTWEKDTKNVQEADEKKGTKADYILKIFSTEEKLENDLLTSVCLEMKDENPDSKSKKTNEDYYKTLDLNRSKKECEYALLVSTLEFKNGNTSPIYRVVEYDNMYVVSPAYMMVFINLIVSLNMKFKELIISINKQQLDLAAKNELLAKFEELKNKLFVTKIDKLQGKVEEISKEADDVIKSGLKIKEKCDIIITSIIGDIQSGLETFEMKISKEYRKAEKATK